MQTITKLKNVTFQEANNGEWVGYKENRDIGGEKLTLVMG